VDSAVFDLPQMREQVGERDVRTRREPAHRREEIFVRNVFERLGNHSFSYTLDPEAHQRPEEPHSESETRLEVFSLRDGLSVARWDECGSIHTHAVIRSREGVRNASRAIDVNRTPRHVCRLRNAANDRFRCARPPGRFRRFVPGRLHG